MPRKATKVTPLPRFPSELMAERENAYHRDEYRRECWVREELEAKPDLVREVLESDDTQLQIAFEGSLLQDSWQERLDDEIAGHRSEVERLESKITKLQDALALALEKCA